jgi:hypothetical protein
MQLSAEEWRGRVWHDSRLKAEAAAQRESMVEGNWLGQTEQQVSGNGCQKKNTATHRCWPRQGPPDEPSDDLSAVSLSGPPSSGRCSGYPLVWKYGVSFYVVPNLLSVLKRIQCGWAGSAGPFLAGHLCGKSSNLHDDS